MVMLGNFLFAAATVLTSETWWDWRSIPATAISPDGQRLVYVVQRQDRMRDAVYSNLWIVNTNGNGARPLTQGDQRDTDPAWSPDGTRIAYITNRTGKPRVMVRWIADGQEAAVTSGTESPSGVSWSPDGRTLAYLERVPAKPAFQVKLGSAPPGATWGEAASVVTRLKWRADKTPGQGLVPEGDTHLFTVPSDGGAPRRISPDGYSFTGVPQWTPDGRRLAATGIRQPDGDRQLYPEDIYAISLDGQIQRLTNGNGNENTPQISPDGRSVAYLGFADKGNAHHNTNLYVTGIDGGTPRQIGVALDRNILHPRWTSNNALSALVEDQGAAHLYELRLDGGARAITTGASTRWATGYADAGPPPAISPNGTVVLSHSSPDQPRDLYAFSLADPSHRTRLTEVNRGVLTGRTIGAVEEIRYKGPDGKAMQGWIIKPPGFNASKKYPMILDIHGGPHAMYGVEFNWQMQVHAARGFVILYTNPRGSTGYGEEFGNIIHTKYPGDDFHDLMAGVDAVLAKGYVDPAKLFVTGGSGGGILTAWVVTHTDRFRAAVSQYPVINWITQAGSSDIPLVTHRWMKSAPWENPQQYLSRSPLMMADKVKTPTMLLTGEEDWRTPIAQTEEFYVALKTRGVDTVMVRFPKEPHGIRGPHPSHWVAKVEYILGWFEKYL
ncbi:MAG: S9 family peptidase [Acidobacteria bacterium]|nr:S9 family peptidase [Acidobacteriota bacterium]